MTTHLSFPMTTHLSFPMTTHLSFPMTTHLSSPSAWMTGSKNGWNQPTNTAASLGYGFGHNVLPALIVFAFVVFFVVKLARRRG